MKSREALEKRVTELEYRLRIIEKNSIVKLIQEWTLQLSYAKK